MDGAADILPDRVCPTKKLCDRLGMVIRIESEYGQYTRVWLQFPESDFQKIGREKTFQN